MAHKIETAFRSYVTLLLSHPVLFLIPYFFLYLAAWGSHEEVKLLIQIFQVLNIFHLGLFLFQVRSLIKKPFFFYFSAWFALSVAVGCYLEYPADTWAHYERIVLWGGLPTISNASEELQRKFYYAWQWSVLEPFPLTARRSILNVLSAFSEFILIIEVYLLSKKLRMDRFWQIFLLITFVTTYGYSLFGIRYYGISTTNIAYAAYLVILGQCLHLTSISIKKILGFLTILLFLYFNHKPEFAFACLAMGISIGLIPLEKRWRNEQINFWIIVFFLVIAFMLFVTQTSPSWFLSNPSGRSLLFIVGALTVLAPVLAICSYRNLPTFFFCLAIGPFLMLLSPQLTGLLQSASSNPLDALRIYWIFPASIPLCFFFKQLEARLKQKFVVSSFRLIALAFVIIVGFPPVHPWRGKLWFQFHIADPIRELPGTDQLADWISKNRNFKLDHVYISDDMTLFALNAHLGRPYLHNRIKSFQLPAKLFSKEAVDAWVKAYRPPFALIPLQNSLPSATPSKVGAILRWPSQFGDIKGQTSLMFETSVNSSLDQLGWTKTFVPPYYLLREPPVKN